MAALGAMRQAFVRLGCSELAATAIMNQGYQSVQDLASLAPEGCEKMCDLANKAAPRHDQTPLYNIGYLFITRLTGISYWAHYMRRLSLPVTANIIQPDLADVQYQLYLKYKRRQKESDVAKPDDFKSDGLWFSWKRKFETYLTQKRGEMDIPLAYVIREDVDAANAAETFTSDIERMIAVTPHTGAEYAEDNGQVFDVLQQALSSHSAYVYITRFQTARNGRAAWQSLCLHNDGPAQLNKLSTTAKNTLKTARFKGNSARFSFEKYIQKHIEAHEILRSPEINEPESEKNKVGYFLDGISDSRLTVSICVVESNPIYLNDFNACHAFLSSVLCKAQQRAKTTEHQGRNVSSTSTTKSKSAYKGKGGGGKGRDNGKKKRGGHGYITPEDWKKLSEDEKQKIRDDRTKSRKTSSVKTNDDEDETASTDTPVTANQAGKQFGKQAHKGDK